MDKESNRVETGGGQRVQQGGDGWWTGLERPTGWRMWTLSAAGWRNGAWLCFGFTSVFLARGAELNHLKLISELSRLIYVL